MGYYDAILHVGDFAYDMDSDNARVGDAFMVSQTFFEFPNVEFYV